MTPIVYVAGRECVPMELDFETAKQTGEHAAAVLFPKTRMFVWAIYERPKDYPHSYVLRRWHVEDASTAGRPDPVPTAVALTIDEVRSALPVGLHRLEPVRFEDPCIKEVWI